MNKALSLVLLGTILISPSCRKRDVADPSYIHLMPVEQNSKPGQGTNLHAIDFVNVLVDDNSIGTYEDDRTFPVLKTGNVTVEARPMVKWLAREGYHAYSMMKSYYQQLNLELLSTDTIRPVFEYEDNVEFAWLEDFNDNSGSLQIRSGTFDSFYVQDKPEHTLDGTPYMYINMGTGETFFEIESQDLFELAQDGREVYLEIDYKCNIAFTVGVFATSPSMIEAIPSVTPFPTDGQWKKGYIYLSDEVYNKGPNVRFRIFIRSLNANQGVIPEIYIDNLKLLYRKG